MESEPAQHPPPLKLELAHVLFADLVGYSRRRIDEQHALLAELNRIVRATESFARAEAAGQLISLPTGDGMALVFFTNPEDPVECALEISRAIRQGSNLPLRLGIHSGPVSSIVDVNGQPNVAGAGINFAQRVMDCGDAGHVLLSARVADDLAHFERWASSLHRLGPCRAKHGIKVEVYNLYTDDAGNPDWPRRFRAHRRARRRLYSLGAAVLLLVLSGIGIAWWWMAPGTRPIALPSQPATAVTADEKSIAVLPFRNLSSDQDSAYFAVGIQDEILTRLAHIGALKVISRTSTEKYANAPQNLPEIARQLGVAYILEGSVQRSGETVRVNVQLIRAATDTHTWAQIYDQPLTDVLAVESTVARAVAEQLQAQLTGPEKQLLAAPPTENPAAYDAYLRGLAYVVKSNTLDNFRGAQRYFEEAVRLDPKFTLAWARLSLVRSRSFSLLTLDQTEAMNKSALAAADTALRLQPESGEALLAKGYYYYACQKDFPTAIRFYEDARRHLPNSSQVPELLGYLSRRRGEWTESVAYLDEAVRLDPRNPNLLTQQALTYVSLRRFPEALAVYDRVLNLTPDDPYLQAQKASVAQAEGDLPRAAALLAPLHPVASDAAIVEAQVYQAILERKPGPAIAQLEALLAKPDPELAAIQTDFRFYLGWAQQVAGDQENAQRNLQAASSGLAAQLKEQPDNWALIDELALAEACLGHKKEAMQLAEKPMALLPITKDAMDGPGQLEIMARVAALTGDPERAIVTVEQLLPLPYESLLAMNLPLTPALLRLDPTFDSLRSNPRFQKLANDKPILQK